MTRLPTGKRGWRGTRVCGRGRRLAVVLPALEQLAACDAIGRDASVVAVLSETGLKGGQPPQRPPTVEASVDALQALFGNA